MEQPVFDLDDAEAAAFCPACGAGYAAGRSRCADCDRDLVPRSEVEAKLTADAYERIPGIPVEETQKASTELPQFDLSDPDAVAFCASCGSGYRAGPLRCVDCDRKLMPRSWADAQATARTLEPAGVDAPVFLADVGNSFKANVLGSVLNDEGIWFTTEPSSWGAVQFLVLPRDLDRAREVVSDLEESEKTLELPDES